MYYCKYLANGEVTAVCSYDSQPVVSETVVAIEKEEFDSLLEQILGKNPEYNKPSYDGGAEA